MGIFGRKKTTQQHPGGLLSSRTPPRSGKPSPKPPKLTREQKERQLLEDYAEECGLDFEEDEELVRYLYKHVGDGGSFVVKKVINKRAVRLIRVVELTDYPTEDLVANIVLGSDGPGPGTYLVFPSGRNRIVARYEVEEAW